MDYKDEKFYFSKKHEVFVHKGQVVKQDENNSLYQKQLEYQLNGGAFDDIGDDSLHIR